MLYYLQRDIFICRTKKNSNQKRGAYQMKTISILKRFVLFVLLVVYVGTATASDRYSTISGIVAVWEANLGGGDAWVEEFTEALNAASDAQLSGIENAGSYDDVRAILLGGAVSSLEGVTGTEALGDLDQDLVYSPVFPCRIFDTRNIGGVGLGTPPINNQPNDYHVYGDAATMTAQGGNPAGCAAPTGKGEPVGISVNIAAIPVSPAGHLRVYPHQGTLPTASFLNYFSAGNVANSGLITTCFLCPGTGQDLSVFNRNTAHSFGDVMGYFYPTIVPDQIPPSAVMFFKGSACPSGWGALKNSAGGNVSGRYLVGMAPGLAANQYGAQVGTALSPLQNRPAGAHSHNFSEEGVFTTGDEVGGLGTEVREVASTTNNRTTNQGNGLISGTNAPYLQLLVCEKQ
jgi:hypothetical protein